MSKEVPVFKHRTTHEAKQAALAALTAEQCRKGRHVAGCAHRPDTSR